jgi:3-hydroxypropanoate dehydrogenase
MHTALAKADLGQLFTEARTHHAWLGKPVSDDLLQEVYDLAKWGPTSANSLPMRILFVKSQAAKEKLFPALMGSNGDQVKAAPVTAVIAYDHKFYEYLPKLSPAFDAKSMFVGNEALIKETELRNGSLQGAYFMLAARALGLDVGPMSGFNNAAVDQAFFQGTPWKSNFLCNVGYGDDTKLYPRGPRHSFEEACKIV